jgi:hypothetical protein
LFAAHSNSINGTNGGEERFMQKIRACTHDGTGAKPVIRARLLVRILFSASVSQRASLILSQKMNRASTPITVLPLVQQEGD